MKSNNPLAFPKSKSLGCGEPQDGMDLLDYFASKAMQSSLSHVQNQRLLGGRVADQIQALADDSYIMAHAMLLAREKCHKITK